MNGHDKAKEAKCWTSEDKDDPDHDHPIPDARSCNAEYVRNYLSGAISAIWCGTEPLPEPEPEPEPATTPSPGMEYTCPSGFVQWNHMRCAGATAPPSLEEYLRPDEAAAACSLQAKCEAFTYNSYGAYPCMKGEWKMVKVPSGPFVVCLKEGMPIVDPVPSMAPTGLPPNIEASTSVPPSQEPEPMDYSFSRSHHHHNHHKRKRRRKHH
jgi:hypothetical protein